jgi:archaellum biogenesis ATPase FlaH
MSDISKEVQQNKIILLSLTSTTYREKVKELLKGSSALFKKICYVTLNDPYKTIKSGAESFADASKFFWIDCVSSTVGTPEKEQGVTFVSSPRALTEISIAIKKATDEEKADFVILDSISAMLVYEKPMEIMKFIHNLTLTMREKALNITFVVLKEDVSEEIKKDLAMFVDKIVEV